MKSYQNRAALFGSEERLFRLVSEHASTKQWAELLRAFLEHAAADGDRGLSLNLLKAGANGGPGWKGFDDRTLLHAAAEGGDENVVSALLQAGHRPELDFVSGSDNASALHRATSGGHTAAVRVLMLAGADVSLIDSRKRSALHYAIEGGYRVIAGDMVIAGADVNAKDCDGDTPLHLAAVHGDGNIVGMLLGRGASVSSEDKFRRHPLHLAVAIGHLTAARALLKAGADPNARFGKRQRRSPLQLACVMPKMTRALLRYGASVEGHDAKHLTALHWAAMDDYPGVIEALIGAGADPEAQTTHTRVFGLLSNIGLTPLLLAAKWRRLGPIATLLRLGANVNATDGRAMTPLHTVCVSDMPRSAEAAEILLRWGADETLVDDYGRTALDSIGSRADPTGRLRRLLKNAPADRMWRCRRALVLYRAYANKVPDDSSNEGGANKASRLRIWTGDDTDDNGGRGDGGDDDELGGLLAWVAKLEDEECFRSIVRFL